MRHVTGNVDERAGRTSLLLAVEEHQVFAVEDEKRIGCAMTRERRPKLDHDDAGKEHARHFDRKIDAQRWIDEQTSRLVTGTHVAPRHARMTVGEWCDIWLEGYRGNRDSTVRQAETHIKRIKEGFGTMLLGSVRPSHVRTW